MNIENLGEWIGIGSYRFRKDKIQLIKSNTDSSSSGNYYIASITISYGDSIFNAKNFGINEINLGSVRKTKRKTPSEIL
jgi:hypothetical protein